MCTSMTWPVLAGREGACRLFGRTLDLDTHFGECVTLTRRETPLPLRHRPTLTAHHPLLGMARVEDGFPLYAEAMNDQGLYMAGLRFAGEACYAERENPHRINLAPWELIPYLLGQCATVEEVRAALSHICVIDLPFSAHLPTAPLHWHIADVDPTHAELTVEITAAGMAVWENPIGVLTNPPVFSEQMAILSEYEDAVTPRGAPLGAGGIGLPGDYSSTSRFVRAAILRRWAAAGRDQASSEEETARFFGVLGAVSPPRGAVLTREGRSHRTLYACCMDGSAGKYHVVTESCLTLRTVGFEGQGADTVL